MGEKTFTVSAELAAELEPYRDHIEELLRLGLRELKMAQALALFREGDISLSKGTKMKRTVTVEIPDQWLEGVPEEQAALQYIFWLGLYQYKVEKALTLYREGAGSLGYIAERLGLNKRDLIREARMRGIEPDFTEETVYEELGR